MPDSPDTTTGRTGRRRLLLVLGGALVLLVGAYVVAALVVGDRVPRGTTVAGVDIGGMARADAEAAVMRELGPRLDAPLQVTAGETATELVPSDAGIVLDARMTVDRAGGGSPWNPAHLVQAIAGSGEDVEPVLLSDTTGLETALEGLRSQIDVAPVDGAITFDAATVNVTAPVDGVELDVDGARDAVTAGLLGDDPVELPVETVSPTIDQAVIDRAVDEFADPAMSAPVTVVAQDTTVELAPADVAPYLTMTVVGDGLEPALDADALLAAYADRFATLVKPPVDAGFTITDGAPVLVPAVDGTTVDPATLGDGLLEALAGEGDARRTEASTTTQEADLTTAEAEALGVVEPIGEFTTNYPIAEYRVINIGRAAELINGTLLEPGEEFSLNGIVGERTIANGFVEGTIIDGGRFRKDLGGGVSQVATTTFNAAFFAGLEDVEHRPHAFYISRYPAGREATVAWGYIDLRFINDSDHGVYIQTVHTTGELTVRMWGTKAWDEIRSVSSERTAIVPFETITDADEECVDQDGVSGFDITVTRQFVRGGEIVDSEDFFTRYKPAADITCT